MDSFSTRPGYLRPAAELRIWFEAPEALRAAGVSIGYQRGFASSEIRLALCRNLAHRVGHAS